MELKITCITDYAAILYTIFATTVILWLLKIKV